MKKLLVLSILAAFACVAAVQAGDNCSDKSKASTCSDSKATCCSSSAKKVAKKADTSVKGAALLMVRR